MTAKPWMPLYVSDYLGDTGHLSTLEHGAYMLLIMHYWQNSGIPAVDLKLARIARLTLPEWQEIRPTLVDLFDADWTHKRIDVEIAIANDLVAKRSTAGKAGAYARYGKRIANEVQSNAPSPSPSPSPIQEQTPSPRLARASRSTATRLPTNFSPDLNEAKRLGLSDEQATREAANFCDYWTAKASNATKRDWPATWRVWCRKAEAQPHRSNGNGKTSPHDRIIEAIADHVRQDRDRALSGETPLSLSDARPRDFDKSSH